MRLQSASMLKSNNSEHYSEVSLMYRSSFSDFLKFMHNMLSPTKYRVSRREPSRFCLRPKQKIEITY